MIGTGPWPTGGGVPGTGSPGTGSPGTWAGATLTAGAASGQPTGALYDLVLLAHVACVLVGLGTVVVSGVQAARLGRLPADQAVPDSLARYYAPGTNWAGRVLYGVPLLGVALLALSHGEFGFSDAWVVAGLLLWAAGTAGAEVWLWPAERRLSAALSAAGAGAPGPTASDPAPRGAPRPEGDHGAPVPTAGRRDVRAVVTVSAGLVVVLVVVSALMVAQP